MPEVDRTMDECRVLIIDFTDGEEIGTAGWSELVRGAKLWDLARDCDGVSPSFVLRTGDLLAGVRCPADYVDRDGPPTPDEAPITLETLHGALETYRLILFHLSNEDPRDAVPLLREARTKLGIPMIEYTASGVFPSETENLWIAHQDRLRISYRKLFNILPRFLRLYVSTPGTRLERFKHCVEQIVFSEAHTTDLLTAFLPLDILVQGALAMLGMRREDRDPWWWLDDDDERVAVDPEPLENALREYERDPRAWFAESVESLRRVLPDGDSNQALLDVLDLLDEHVVFAVQDRLLPVDGTGSASDGALLQLAKTIVRGAAAEATGEDRNRELLTSAGILRQAHVEFSGMCRELC